MKKIIFVVFLFIISCSSAEVTIENGIDIFFEDTSLYENSKIALVMNHTSKDKSGKNLFDLSKKSLNVKAIFSPEHGLFGTYEAGGKVKNSNIDGIPVYSLYGKNKKPTLAQLKDIDIILFDLQDIGSRYYTYISTLTYVMEAAAENGIKIIILDRFNPLGNKVEGPQLYNEFSSFVGMHPVPIRHGLTIGEFAILIKENNWINNASKIDLEIININGWKGDYVELSLPPSPNIPDLETAIIYNGLCLLEGTNLSEGRGTETPFKVFGAPWLNSQKIIDIVSSQNLKGVRLDTLTFTPISIPGKSVYPKYKDSRCNGISIHITNRNIVFPLKLAVTILKAIYETHPEQFMVSSNGFLDKLYGSDVLVKNIFNGSSIDELLVTWNEESLNFKEMIKPFRLY